jgi:hypothetical protein
MNLFETVLISKQLNKSDEKISIDGQLPEIKLDIRAHDGKLNKAYIAGLNVSIK